MHLTSASLSLSRHLFFSFPHRPLPPRFLVFFNRRASCNDRPLFPTIHPSLLSLFTRLFHRKLHSRGFLSIPIIVVRTNDRNGENTRVESIVVFFFFLTFWILDFSRIIFSFVKMLFLKTTLFFKTIDTFYSPYILREKSEDFRSIALEVFVLDPPWRMRFPISFKNLKRNVIGAVKRSSNPWKRENFSFDSYACDRIAIEKFDRLLSVLP